MDLSQEFSEGLNFSTHQSGIENSDDENQEVNVETQNATTSPVNVEDGTSKGECSNAITGGNFSTSNIHVGDKITKEIYNYPPAKEAPPNRDKLFEQLQEKLKTVAGVAVAKSNLPIDIDQPINEVQLELTTDLQTFNLNHSGHFHRREDFVNMHKPPQGNISLNEIYKHAADNAQKEADRNCKTESEKLQHISQHGNIVAIKGQCGIGKTTITKLLTKQILLKSLFCITYLFYIPIRAIDFVTKCNLLEFLLRSCCCVWKHSDVTDEIILEELNTNPNVILIMDGLDEATMSMSDIAPVVSLHNTASAEHFIKNILSGNLLPNAKKLITSRPRQLYDLHVDHRPHFIASVLGLGKSAQKKLCSEMCDSNAQKLAEYLDNNPNLSAYCYVPVICILTIYCINESMKKNDVVNLGSITSTLVNALNGLIRSDNVRGSFELRKLAFLAWNGFKEQKITFEETDLKFAEIDNETSGNFLETVTHSNTKFKILELDKKSYFSHLIWQEFFSAMHLLIFTPLQEFKEQVSNFGDNRWEILTKFLFGLCNKENAALLQNVLEYDAVDVKEKKDALLQFALRSIHGFQPSTFAKFKSFVGLTLSLKDSIPPNQLKPIRHQEILRICDWCFEANEDLITNCLAEALPDKIKLEKTILPSDVINLNYLLRASQAPLVICIGGKFSGVKFADGCFARFFKELQQTMETNPNVIKLGKEMSIFDSTLSDDGLESFTKCMQYSGKFDRQAAYSNRLDRLELSQCKITDKGWITISSAIQRLHYCLSKVDLINIEISEEGLLEFASCIWSINELKMWYCNISATGVKLISTAINSSPRLTKYLDLSENYIGDEGAVAISSCIHKIKKLDLSNCGITSAGVKSIISRIQDLQKPIERLDISNNDITDDAIRFVCCVHNIKKLCMCRCNISQSVEDVIQEAARRAGTKVKVGYSD